MSVTLTCDRADGLIRAAVWDGKILRDLYIDRIGDPDFSGAVARGKIVRVAPGGKAGWVEAGLPEKLYLESSKPLRTGELVTVRIRTVQENGKAWLAAQEEGGEDAPPGLLLPPPLPWQRALADLGAERPKRIQFAAKEDFEACADERAELSRESVHPELDDILAALQERTVPLPGGATLVIETTEALTAIDVNAGEGASPLSANLLAVRAAAHQIRLRQIGGIVVIDALKMKDRTDHAKLLAAFKNAVAPDPAGVNVFGLTKLGLIELTRVRRGRNLAALFVGA